MVHNIVQDWAPYPPLTILSIILLILFPFLSKPRKNALIALAVLILPVGGTYIIFKLLHITHFVTSRYFINLLPLFLITLFLCLDGIGLKFERIKTFARLRVLFLILFITSNLIILPFYYSSEKQDLRGLVSYLKGELKEGDKIIVENLSYFSPMLHYFGVHPQTRQHIIPGRKILRR